MTKIPLEKAVLILNNASAVIVDDRTLIYPAVADLDGSDDNQFLRLSWTDDDFQDYATCFSEGANREVGISASSMFLVDIDGDEMQITILAPEDIEKIYAS